MTRRAADLAFWAGAFGLGIAVLAVERAVLVALFRGTEPAGEVAGSFLHGLRFDAAGLAYPLAAAFLVCTVVGFLRRTDGGAVRGAAVALGFVALVAAVEVPFFREFRVRLDFVALEYLDDPGAALGLAFATVGVGGTAAVLGAAAGTTALCVAALRRLRAAGAAAVSGPPDVVASVVVAAAFFVAARGGFGRPVRPQDADRSVHAFVNQLDLSGPFTLVRHAYEAVRGAGESPDRMRVGSVEADALVRSWLGGDVDGGEDGGAYGGADPARRTERLDSGIAACAGRNVVLILMESAASRHVGACGAAAGESWTPEFDRIAGRGLLFRNHWANGPSTNRAVPAIFASVPSLPLRLGLTKSSLGRREFASLPRLLGERGWDSCFVTAGRSSWENVGGWLRQQGVKSVVDADDPAFDLDRMDMNGRSLDLDDAAVLGQCLKECDARAAAGRFFVSALTVTNHPPFPRVEPGTGIRERAMRNADRELGRFMDDALARPWAARTLFVLVGDHGFHDAPQAAIDPDRYRVPLLLIAPGGSDGDVPTLPRAPDTDLGALVGEPGARVTDVLTSHVDLLPTIVGLVAPGTVEHASWGTPIGPSGPRSPYVVLGPHGGQDAFAVVDVERRFLVARLDGTGATLHRVAPGALEPLEPDARTVGALSLWGRSYLASAQRALAAR